MCMLKLVSSEGVKGKTIKACVNYAIHKMRATAARKHYGSLIATDSNVHVVHMHKWHMMYRQYGANN